MAAHYLIVSLFYCLVIKTSLLTTVLPNGGQVPETSRNFHYWQPAPSRMTTLMAGKSWQLSHEPSCGKETGTCHTELSVERGRGERENAWRCAPMHSKAHCKCYCCKGCQHVTVKEHIESWCMHIILSKHCWQLHVWGHRHFFLLLTLLNCI